MKKHSYSPSAREPFNPEPPNTSPKARVRYVGFEGVNGSRRLSFCVKLPGHDSVGVTFEISEASLKHASGISIQDAAPMAYEKIVELLGNADTFDSKELRLTEADIAHYIARHLTSQKRTYSMGGKTRPSHVAA
jgi:hypothetical protein